MRLFGHVAAEYDAARPSYPEALFDALGPLAGLLVLDVGAGTGLATRSLVERNALAVAIEPEAQLLIRAVEHIPRLAAVIADGAQLPVGDRSVDLVCFAQSWHWLDPHRGPRGRSSSTCRGAMGRLVVSRSS